MRKIAVNMPPKGKGKKSKKEVLPSPQTLPDGERQFYIGGWSSYGQLEDICRISDTIVQSHTREDREVSPLPRTNVLILPRIPDFFSNGSEEEEFKASGASPESEPDGVTELVLADQMRIEGVSFLTVCRSETAKKEWVRVVEEGEEDSINKSAPPSGPPSDEVPPESEEKEAIVHTAPVEAEAEKETNDAAEEVRNAYREEAERLAAINVSLGADFSVKDAVLDGVIRFIGVLPQMVVHPELPIPPVRENSNVKKGGKKGTAGKDDAPAKTKGKKVKLTPEELAEIERKMADEDAKFLEDTEAAITRAKEEEDYLMTFAHPYRWANIIVSNITFTGPVQVVRSHVKFLNCRFASPFPNRPQLLVHQYCQVECTQCTFEAPGRSGIYGLPASQVRVKQCLFTGILQLHLVRLEAGGDAKVYETPKAAAAQHEVDEEDAAADERDGLKKKELGGKSIRKAVVPEAIVDKVKSARLQAVGVFTDSSRVLIENCRFLLLGTGVLFHGKYKVEKMPPRQHLRSTGKKEALATLRSCDFQHIFSSAICVDRTADDLLIHRNVVSDCGYYGIDLRQGCRDISIYQNKFLHDAPVRVRKGVQPQLLRNELHSVPIDDNRRDNPCLEVRY